MECSTLYGVATWIIFKVNKEKIEAFLNKMLEKVAENCLNKVKNKGVYFQTNTIKSV